MPARVVITGIGPVTPIGIGRNAFWEGILAEKSAIHRLQAFDASPFKAKAACELRGFHPENFFPHHRLKRLDRFSQFAMLSARLALEDAGLADLGTYPRDRAGVSFGSALGGFSQAESQHAHFLQSGPHSVNRALAFQIFGGSAQANIAIEYGLEGPCAGNANSCASGNMALGDAFRLIQGGHADLIIAGGAEAPLSPLTFAAFDNLYTMSRHTGDPIARACRPFDRHRDGFVMGEGAASVVMENLTHAKTRGARIYAEVLGYATATEAYHMTSPEPSGRALIRVMRTALKQARLHPNAIGVISAHASSTRMNDANEAFCIREVFGPDAPPVHGFKSYAGHSLGAAGAIEAIALLLAMKEGYLIPTLHLEDQDPEIALDCVPLHGREARLRFAMNNAFGFGGIDSTLIFGAI